ncbi:MAG: TolC family protein [Campylobacterota bacterium]|nr:TolC family protein [Campylobacterota bacterium]
MKVLKDWREQLKKFHNYLLSSLFVSINLYANENVLSQNKHDILNYSYDKSIQDSEKLKKDWINPIYYKYIYNNGETYTTQKSFISISQPIFKSGGIYYAIKYASSMERYSKTSIDTQKKELIKQTVNILFQIKKINITIEKQKLSILNAKLDIQRKKEQVLNGILDTSFLDNAIIESNVKQNGLIDLEYQKETFINNLSTLSDKEYTELELPVLKLIKSENYLENNIYIKQAKEDIDSSYWMKNMTLSNYLPTINFTGDYTKYHDIDNSPALSKDGTTNVGFNITIPFDIKYSYQIQSSKIEYLQKKSTLEDKKREELSKYKNAISKIDSIDKKIDISLSDIKLYDSLLIQIKEQLSVGMKTQSDLDTMVNSKKIKELDSKSLEIEKQIELLEIYSRIEMDKY